MRARGVGTRALSTPRCAAGVHPVEMLEVAGVEALKRMAEAGVAVVPCEGL
jgi:hypothetical protein